MRALVTGGAGFIGSNLVDGLLEAGHQVEVIDDLSTGREDQVAPAATLHRGDVADAAGVHAVVTGAAPEVVFHLAAQIDVRRAVADPGHDAAVNVGGTIAVLEAARAAGARRVVLASTGGAIYGDTDVVPTPETHSPQPMAPYGVSKLCAEHYLDLYERLHGLSSVALRFANVYGPRQDPLGEGGVVAIYCGLAARGGQAIVFGDGLQTRDFVFVGDVVEALMLAADDGATGAYNVGTGVETTVTALADALGLPREHAPERAGEVRRSCLDPGAAAAAIGWRPRTPLAEGLRRTQAWAAGGG
jgi:UDP-glucose 4-epimerase